ncbi:phosphatase PAP2 family protein [Kamptonema formosum]|uniref:phosphatase PAP2 family protein n=1 Tax=Kamptonema formosum TaxID=331992 RepID=UPI000345D811|nr:phosphatase PAP2 family protein [Oscillatoria sp. PCC 10802]
MGLKTKLLSILSTIRIAGLLQAGLAMSVFAWIAKEVLRKQTAAFDTAILMALRQTHTPLLDRAVVAVTFLGEPEFLLALCAGSAAVLLRDKRRSEATTLGIAAAGAVGLNYWLKHLFSRDRPALWDRIVDVGFYSFPSGHAMISMVVYGMLGYLLAKRFPRWRGLIVSSTVVLIAAIGLSRLYLGVHWPTDVIAGYSAGVVWLIACILSLEVWREYRLVAGGSADRSLLPD